MNTQSEKTPPIDIEGLVWAMLDENISDADFQQLDDLLRDDEDARRVYLQCIQLHVDLANFYATQETKPVGPSVGIPLSVMLPITDAVMADPAF